MIRMLVDTCLIDALQVVSQGLSQHLLRKDSGFWYEHCQEHTCVASKTVQQQDSAAGSNFLYECREMLPAADLERWIKPLRGRFNSPSKLLLFHILLS